METKIIEINGIKLEVDLRTAKQVSHYKVGDKVRVLVKSYSDKYSSYAGIIVGFDDFVHRPTIVVAYLDTSAYSGNPLKFIYLNNDSSDCEIAPMIDDFIALEKSQVIDLMNRDITKKEEELVDMQNKKEYFLKYFGVYFK